MAVMNVLPFVLVVVFVVGVVAGMVGVGVFAGRAYDKGREDERALWQAGGVTANRSGN